MREPGDAAIGAITSRSFEADCSVGMREAVLSEASAREVVKAIFDAAALQKLKEGSV